MLATYVPPVRTRYSFEDLAYSLEVGLAGVLGKQPSRETLAVALAKCRLETGNGQFAWNHNLGNVKCPATAGGNYTCIELNEVIKGKVEWFAPQGKIAHKNGIVIGEASTVPPGHPQTRMQALAGPTDAGFFYIDFVAGKTRYAKAWQALLAGNPEAYSRELAAAGYYTAPVEQYTKAVMALYVPSLAKLTGKPHEEVSQPERAEWHNKLLIDGFVRSEYERLLDGPSLGGGSALLEHERHDTDVSELAPESEPYANG
jgi:hypothetical protein